MTPPSTLQSFGFRLGRGGTHAARTMMLSEVSALLASTQPGATRDEFREQVVDRNLLGKPTLKSRQLTFKHLVELYGLSSELPLYRSMRKLWDADPASHPLLALLMALARDPLLRLSESFIASAEVGQSISREDIEGLLETDSPDRFSPASLKSFAQNINGTWTQAGFLSGRARKVRAQPRLSCAAVTFALLLGHLEGLSGQRLFQSHWAQLLSRSLDELEALATQAYNQGLIVFRNAGGVKEVRFPDLLTPEEERLLHE